MLVNRRQFLITSLGTVALAVASPEPVSRIGIAVIGLGTQGLQLLQELLWLRESHPIEIVSLCDVQPGALQEPGQWVPQAYPTGDYQDALTDVQAVVIATPDSSHAVILEAVLKAGLDVYLEPPLARSSQEAEQLIQLARERGCIVQLGIHQVNHSGYAAAREVVTSGGLGKISHIEIAVSLEALSTPPTWQLSREFSDGQAALILTRVFEIVRYIMDVSIPFQVAAQGGVYVWQDGRTNPDTIHVLLNYSQGFLLSFSMGLAKSAFNIYGTRGTLDLLNWQRTSTGAVASPILEPPSAQSSNTLRMHLADWLTCIQRRYTPRLPIQSGYDQVRLVESVLSAYHDNRSSL